MYIPINNVDLQNGVETFESPFSFRESEFYIYFNKEEQELGQPSGLTNIEFLCNKNRKTRSISTH